MEVRSSNDDDDFVPLVKRPKDSKMVGVVKLHKCWNSWNQSQILGRVLTELFLILEYSTKNQLFKEFYLHKHCRMEFYFWLIIIFEDSYYLVLLFV